MSMITDAEIVDVCGRISEALKTPSTSWVVFFETQDLNGAPSYTYRIGVSYCDTADIAIRHALDSLPRFIDPATTRMRRVSAVRDTDITEYDGYRFNQTPQFQVR
jgi:hypothetical protein